MPDQGKELAGFLFVPGPKDCRSIVSQVETELAIAAASSRSFTKPW
jgi:hypothetical protein